MLVDDSFAAKWLQHVIDMVGVTPHVEHLIFALIFCNHWLVNVK